MQVPRGLSQSRGLSEQAGHDMTVGVPGCEARVRQGCARRSKGLTAIVCNLTCELLLSWSGH